MAISREVHRGVRSEKYASTSRNLIQGLTVVLQAIHNGAVKSSDFICTAAGSALTGRKRFIGRFERRLSHEVIHPIFGHKVSYRRLLELQTRLLIRHLLGELAEYPNFTTR
jgi:CRISPR-associated protein Cas1